MPSIRARLFNWYMERTLKSQPIHLMPAETLRQGAEAVAPKKAPKGLSLEIVDGEVKGEWHRPVGQPAERTVYYLHGGGYVFGSALSHRAATFALAKEASADVLSLDYRMAPEHVFPAAVEDAIAGYRWLLSQGRDASSIVIGGDSAGGGLTMALLLSIKEQGLPMPAGAVLYSPWTDLAVTGASLDANEKTDSMFKAEYIREGAKRYLGDADAKSPLASPLYGDCTELPPILIFASKSEVLLDDAVRLHEKLQADGTRSELILEEGLIHVWPIFAGRFPEAMTAVRKASAFIRERTPQQ